MSVPIRIMNTNFQLIAETDKYSSLQLTRSWHGVGMLELRINRYLKGANQLTRGKIIFPHDNLNKAHQIKYREIELDEKGKATENWVIRALPLKSWLGQRITYPPLTTAYDSKQAVAETVMLHYLTNNVISPSDIERVIPDLILDVNLLRGDNIMWQSRFKNLAEEITHISLLSQLGWNIDVDVNLKKFVFKVMEGRNLTASQLILPPAIFSPEFNTLGQLSYSESELNYKNFAVVAGQGEGVDRRIVKVGNSSGFDRHEIFVDARDVAETSDADPPTQRPILEVESDLMTRGQQVLSEFQQEIYLEGQSLMKSRLTYGINYDLGDLVTLKNREWGISADARITEVKEIYEPNNTKIELVFGNNKPTLISKIKQELSGIKQELTR